MVIPVLRCNGGRDDRSSIWLVELRSSEKRRIATSQQPGSIEDKERTVRRRGLINVHTAERLRNMVQTQSSPWHESGSIPSNGAHTILCFSHLRWKFVFQRPQHLMSRFADQSRFLFWEEPCLVEGLPEPDLHIDV